MKPYKYKCEMQTHCRGANALLKLERHNRRFHVYVCAKCAPADVKVGVPHRVWIATFINAGG